MLVRRVFPGWLGGAALVLASAGGVEGTVAPMWDDDLEEAATLTDLFPADASRFTQLQAEHGGVCTLETSIVHGGSSSVRCHAPATGSAKADLGRQDVSRDVPDQPAPPRFGQDADQELWAEMWLYVREAGLCEGLFLWDIEESAANNAGLRIHCKTDPATGVDYLKMNSEFGPSFQPDPPYIQFPFDEWARVRVYVRFQARGGIVKIWVNDALVLDAVGPTARRRRSIYDSIQWGATINASDRAQTVYVDDVKIWNTDPAWEAAQRL